MARRLVERSFDPAKPVVVRRPFTGAGRHFRPGDAFNWRQMAVNQRRVRQLYDAGKLMHPEEGTLAPQPVKEPAPASTVEAAPTTDPPPLSSEDAVAPADAPEDAGAGPDDLDAIDTMAELREVAKAEGAPLKTSKVDQRAAIREHRNAADA